MNSAEWPRELFSLERTTDSLNEKLPIKMTRKVSKKMIFVHGKDSRFSPRITHKMLFSLDSTDLKIWVENSDFAIQHIEKKKKVFSSDPPP